MDAEHQNRTFDVRSPASRRCASRYSILNNGRFSESKKAMDGLFTTSSQIDTNEKKPAPITAESGRALYSFKSVA